ncbi:MAG: hypothetical protein LBT78_11410 [Tannerella sp.]|jgi:hypothetical protein|nr:hypothetical protein [Tannerella sp.]
MKKIVFLIFLTAVLGMNSAPAFSGENEHFSLYPAQTQSELRQQAVSRTSGVSESRESVGLYAEVDELDESGDLRAGSPGDRPGDEGSGGGIGQVPIGDSWLSIVFLAFSYYILIRIKPEKFLKL